MISSPSLPGVTAMLNSLARLPHRRAAGASAAIVDITPALLEGAAGVRTLAQLTATALRLGVGQMALHRLQVFQGGEFHWGFQIRPRSAIDRACPGATIT